MKVRNLIREILSSPLTPDWSVERLADRLLEAIAEQAPGQDHEFILDAEADRQSQRLIRPLLACLAARSAGETGTAPNLYGGRLAFQRSARGGATEWVLGEFENRPGTVRLILRLSIPPTATPTAATDATWTTNQFEQSPG